MIESDNSIARLHIADAHAYMTCDYPTIEGNDHPVCGALVTHVVMPQPRTGCCGAPLSREQVAMLCETHALTVRFKWFMCWSCGRSVQYAAFGYMVDL